MPDGLSAAHRKQWIDASRVATKESNDTWLDSASETKPATADLVPVTFAEWEKAQAALRASGDPIAHFDATAFRTRLNELIAARRAADREQVRAALDQFKALSLTNTGSAGAESGAAPGADATVSAEEAAAAERATASISQASSLPPDGTSTTGLQLGHTLLHASQTTSTMTLMTGALQGLPAGSVFVADVQRAGRGRGSNVWVSPAGCLMCNVSFRIRSGAQLPFVQYLVGWAIVSVLRKHPLGARLNARLKWPNDILLNGRKVGGIICQSTMDSNAGAGGAVFGAPTFTVHAGFGVNVEANPEYPSLNTDIAAFVAAGAGARLDFELPPLAGKEAESAEAAAAALEAARPFCRATVLADVLATLDTALAKFNEHGFEPFLEEYLTMWLHSGQLVTAEGKDGTYRITGLSTSGYLRAQSVSRPGESVELHPDGNSFDMKQSFIAVKRL